MSSGGPSPSYPHPNNGDKGKGKGKGWRKGKNNGSDNNSKGSNTPAWPSFYNLWINTITIWSGMRLPQHPVHPPLHALLAAPAYYGTLGSFTPLSVPPSHHCTSSRTRPLPGLPGRARGISSH
jgi:hypothetical protein